MAFSAKASDILGVLGSAMGQGLDMVRDNGRFYSAGRLAIAA
jgi:hypothetical protein